MLALQDLGYSSLLVENQAFDSKMSPDFDARSLALSPASQRILNHLGLWDLLKQQVTPIKTIHISEQGYFGMARLSGDANHPLGYVVEMQHINAALHQALRTE